MSDSELSRLINRLQRGIERKSSYIKTISHPALLVASLQELNELIGNEKVKDAVATQVSHLIMVKRRSMDDNTVKDDELMLNTVLYGPPGVGKTLVGTKLAKIWYSLGYLEKKKDAGNNFKKMFAGALNENGLSNNSGEAMSKTTAVYLFIMFIVVLVSLLSLTWNFYLRFGGIWVTVALLLLSLLILSVAYFLWYLSSGAKKDDFTKNKDGKNTQINTKEYKDSQLMFDIPADEDIIKIVSKSDFVGKYVGHTAPKTNALLEENLGKVLFVDEAYSILNSPSDDFGMEALTALNLFLSQHPGEIIVIFAGYKDLLEAGVFSAQPGLKRRFMWQFECSGYNEQELFEIIKLQANTKGWNFSDEQEIKRIVEENYDVFEGYGGDTKRALFFAQLEHSREFIGNEKRVEINTLTPNHIKIGIEKLRENNIQNGEHTSDNPMANMMNMFRGKHFGNKTNKNTKSSRAKSSRAKSSSETSNNKTKNKSQQNINVNGAPTNINSAHKYDDTYMVDDSDIEIVDQHSFDGTNGYDNLQDFLSAATMSSVFENMMNTKKA